MNSVFVIILNYNHREDLEETINSFKLQNYPDLHLVVSDNGSTDSSIRWLKENYPDIEVLENKTNLGWAEGNNVGIRYALKNKADYILLANNDLSFNSTSVIQDLLSAFDMIPELGIIGPRENSYFNHSLIINQGWILYPKSRWIFNTYRSGATYENYPQNYKFVDNVSGSFMLFRSVIIEDIGFMDQSMYLYAEDTDFALRAWRKGWISAVDKNITIYHKVSATSGDDSPLKLYYKTRNLIYLIRKQRDLPDNHHYFLLKYYFDSLILLIKILILKRYSKKRVAKLKAHALGFIHGTFLHKMGEQKF